MTALTPRHSAVPDRASGDALPFREEPRLAESVYRVVTALRADPRLGAEALPPDVYLAVADSVVPAHATERRVDEFPRRIEPRGRKEPQS